MTYYRVKVTEVHDVEIELEAVSAEEAMNKVESGDLDNETTFYVSDETVDREAHSAVEVEDEEEGE